MTEFLASLDSLEGFQSVDMDEVRNINGGGSATSGNTQGLKSILKESASLNKATDHLTLLTGKTPTPVKPSSATSASVFEVKAPTPTASVRG